MSNDFISRMRERRFPSPKLGNRGVLRRACTARGAERSELKMAEGKQPAAVCPAGVSEAKQRRRRKYGLSSPESFAAAHG